MKARTHTRWIQGVALGLAVAGIAATSAQAYYFGEPGSANNVPSNESAWQTIVPSKAFPTLGQLQQIRLTPGEATHPFSFTPSNEPAGPTVVIPDPTRGLPSADDLQPLRFTPEPIVTPVASTPSGGIDWPDAGIGAGMALGALLLGAAAALGLRRRRPAHS